MFRGYRTSNLAGVESLQAGAQENYQEWPRLYTGVGHGTSLYVQEKTGRRPSTLWRTRISSPWRQNYAARCHAAMLSCAPGSVLTGADPILGCPMPVVKSWLVLGCAAAAL